jgi:hypothetical protein
LADFGKFAVTTMEPPRLHGGDIGVSRIESADFISGALILAARRSG